MAEPLRASVQTAANPWPADLALCNLSPQGDPLLLANAFEGVQIFGGIGSGKTSGSGAHLARAYLSAGMGGLVLCAKKDERETWEEYAAQTGRVEDLMIFDATGERYLFNFLRYEMERPGEGGGYTENIVRMFSTIVENMERGKGGSGGEPYWVRAMQQLMRNAVDLLSLSGEAVSVPNLVAIALSAPSSPEQVWETGLEDGEEGEPTPGSWQGSSFCWHCIGRGQARKDAGELDEWETLDFDATVDYWLAEWAQLDERPRSGVLSMFTTMADAFMRRPFRKLFCSGQRMIPEHSHRGKIIILDLPVKEFADAGRAAQVMFKYIWQQAAERRDVRSNPRPVFLWVDEAQVFASAYDMQFQATARSSKACTVYLTQNLPNYYAEFGSGVGKHRVDSLVGNLQTKVFHANSDPETNKFAAETIGKVWGLRRGGSLGSSSGQGPQGGSGSASESFQENLEYQVEPQQFTMLRKGGPVFDFEVDAVIFQNGRVWSHGATFLTTTFHQR